MPELTPKQVKKLERLSRIIEDGDVGILENLLETEEKFEELKAELEAKVDNIVAEVKASAPNMKDLLEQIRGTPGYTPKKGVDYDDGKPGENYVLTTKDKKEIAKSIQIPVIEKVVERIEIVKEQPIVTEVVREVAVFSKKMMEEAVPAMGERIRDSLELLPEGEKLKIEAIQDLRKELDDLKTRPVYMGGGGVTGQGARDLVKDIDLSASLDGVTKTFNIQAVWNIVSVSLDSYPYGTLRKTIDYTWTPTSITFTSTIDASTQLAAGQKCILTVVQG